MEVKFSTRQKPEARATKRELAWRVTKGRKGLIPDDTIELQLAALKEELEEGEQPPSEDEAELGNATTTHHLNYS